MSTLSGALHKTLEEIQLSTSPASVSFQGYTLGPQSVVIAKSLGINTSSLFVDLSRCGIQDEEGSTFGKLLRKNQTMRVLQMEANMLGPKSANDFGQNLAHNTGLIHLDLQSNLLTADNELHGFYSLVEALKTNKSLLSLNISNCGLDPECGKILLEAM